MIFVILERPSPHILQDPIFALFLVAWRIEQRLDDVINQPVDWLDKVIVCKVYKSYLGRS